MQDLCDEGHMGGHHLLHQTNVILSEGIADYEILYIGKFAQLLELSAQYIQKILFGAVESDYQLLIEGNIAYEFLDGDGDSAVDLCLGNEVGQADFASNVGTYCVGLHVLVGVQQLKRELKGVAQTWYVAGDGLGSGYCS